MSSLVTDTTDGSEEYLERETRQQHASYMHKSKGRVIKDFRMGIMQNVPPLGLEPRYPA